MAKTASASTPVKFSDKESRLLKLLSQKPRSTDELITAYYGKDVPINGRATIVDRLGGVEKKLAWHKDPRRVAKSKRDGPNSIFWSVVKR